MVENERDHARWVQFLSIVRSLSMPILQRRKEERERSFNMAYTEALRQGRHLDPEIWGGPVGRDRDDQWLNVQRRSALQRAPALQVPPSTASLKFQDAASVEFQSVGGVGQVPVGGVGQVPVGGVAQVDGVVQVPDQTPLEGRTPPRSRST